MPRDPAATAVAVAGLVLWAGLIAVPLAHLYATATASPAPTAAVGPPAATVLRSFALAGGIAAVSVVLGYAPGRLLGTAGRARGLLLGVLLAPLLLPRYLLLYAWELVRSPTTPVGDWLSARPGLARLAGTLTSSLTLVLWYWPLAAVVIGQGFRSMDRDTHEESLLDASAPQRFARVTLPLLAPALLLAFGVCFVMVLSEFATFHLAGIETLGTALAVLYAETGSATHVARAAWPVAIPAAVVAVALWRESEDWTTRAPVASPPPPRRPGWSWAWLGVLLSLTILAPVALLAGSMRDPTPFAEFVELHREELGTSLLAAAAGGGGALVLAAGALALGSLGRFGRAAAWVVHPTILLAALLPGGLLGAALVHVQTTLRAAVGFRDGWWSVSAGLAARLAGVVLLLLRFGAHARSRRLAELAATDGAGWARTWRSVHLPLLWPLAVAAVVLATMLGLAELPATTVLLPAGVPNFAQGLLNQMHYARDQQVIASCLILVGSYAVLAGIGRAGAGLVRLRRRTSLGLMVVGLALVLGGCGGDGRADGPKVARSFGRTGRGPGEFLYPRAIDFAPDGTLWVADKTGRFQHFDAEGRHLGGFTMPQIEAGKPTGFSVGADGLLYIADTHYHRVVVYAPDGTLRRQFGTYGQGPGQFIYPTDVAFAPDGRLFVSEYGGNDRVSIWSRDAAFLGSFGSFGSGRGELSRPSALKVDARRRCLYVADACNHRIAVYGLDGTLLRYIGKVGRGPGEFRYPYDLALAPDGRVIVCEYGNNRIQVLSPEGKALAVHGSPGRELGQLAYPWGVALAPSGLAYVVDAGNNRIQAWEPH